MPVQVISQSGYRCKTPLPPYVFVPAYTVYTRVPPPASQQTLPSRHFLGRQSAPFGVGASAMPEEVAGRVGVRGIRRTWAGGMLAKERRNSLRTRGRRAGMMHESHDPHWTKPAPFQAFTACFWRDAPPCPKALRSARLLLRLHGRVIEGECSQAQNGLRNA